ncbi:DUF2069 domain-containing protein [Xanthomonadaceae bacterium JHOS43]|nr:DUF2069 domain-containing protein [Xanthomonadaceae bacterium JHOS43]
MIARRITATAIIALALLAACWHLWWFPPARVPAWLAAILHAAPMLPAAVLAILQRRSAPFWGALGALMMFSHGVMEAWSNPAARGLALTEVALALAVIFGASWNGFRHRMTQRRKV